jgi:DNA polymerase III alpha subunit
MGREGKMERKEYKHKSINGVVITAEDRYTSSGRYMAQVRIRDNENKVWRCVFWNEQAASFMAMGLLGERVYVEGGMREENAISVRFFDAKPIKSLAPAKVTQSSREEYLQYLKDQNRVIVPYVQNDGSKVRRSCHKSECIKVNGHWENKLEYCLRTMGPSGVMDWLREYKDNGKPGRVVSTFKGYRERLALMIEACQAHNGDYIEQGE